MAGRPNNAGAIAAKIQGLREAKAAFQALPEIVRDAMLDATTVTVQMIAAGAKGRILASPSVQTRALYNHITWSITKTNGRGRVGVASGTTAVSNLSTRTSVKVKGLIQSRVGKDGKTTHRIVQPSRYARMVEFGTVHMHAEPFMIPATESQAEPYLQRCRAAGSVIERNTAVIGMRNL